MFIIQSKCMKRTIKDIQYYKFSAYGFLKNLRFFDAFLLLFLIEKGMSYSQIGIMYAVREIVINVFEIPSGIIADTWGRKRALAGSFLFYIISFIVYYFSSNFLLFLLAFGFYGIADAFRTGTHKGMIMDYLKLNGWADHKTEYYGHTRAWSQRGSAISSLIAGLIVFYAGRFQSVFLYSVIPYLLNLLLLISYPNTLNYSSDSGTGVQLRNFKATITNFFKMMGKPRVLSLISSSAVHTAYQSAVKDYIQPIMVAAIATLPFLIDLDVKQRNGLFIGIIYFVIYLLTSRSSRMAGLVGKQYLNLAAKLTLFLGLASGIFCGLFFGWSLWWWSLASFSLVYIIENLRKPIMTGLVADEVPNAILASVLSAQSQLKTIFAVLIALLIGFLADWVGLGTGLVVVSAILLLVLLLTSFVSSIQRSV